MLKFVHEPLYKISRQIVCHFFDCLGNRIVYCFLNIPKFSIMGTT